VSTTHSKTRRYVATGIIYLALVASVFGFNVIRAKSAKPAETAATQPEAPTVASTKPYFSLTTNRTYSPNESARLWASYQNVDYLDFRVYRVKDPNKFFKQLDDPHQMGEEEKAALSKGYGARLSLLERTHRFKLSIFSAVKDYVRDHLLAGHRATFNEKFRKEKEATRTPLNVADYARVPLLNPDQKVKDWREKLPALENEYDSRTILIGKMDPGVYLIEGVNGDLRAYSIAIVTSLTMVQKSTSDGQILVYVVDRKTGAPREGADIEVTGAKNTLATGKTDKSGVFKTEIKPDTKNDEVKPEDRDPEDSKKNAYLVMARDRDNFAISDIDAF
jgi:alpha-2-macroglobulin